MVVVDASVVVTACLSEDGFQPLTSERLVAPQFLWSEVPSVLHELRWRGSISLELADLALERFLKGPIAPRRTAALVQEAWRVADELGWARTYDAEYVALARLLGCRLLTTDARLRRGAAGLVKIAGPTEA